jgi:hypothetical protein
MKPVLVYDMRRDKKNRADLSKRLGNQWRAYLQGKKPVQIIEGCISKLYYSNYEGEDMFQLDEGSKKSSCSRLGDDSWYAVGRKTKIEVVVFKVPDPIGDMPIVTRIWIGE